MYLCRYHEFIENSFRQLGSRCTYSSCNIIEAIITWVPRHTDYYKCEMTKWVTKIMIVYVFVSSLLQLKTEMTIITAVVSVIRHTVLNCHAGIIKLIEHFLKMFIIIKLNLTENKFCMFNIIIKCFCIIFPNSLTCILLSFYFIYFAMPYMANLH